MENLGEQPNEQRRLVSIATWLRCTIIGSVIAGWALLAAIVIVPYCIGDHRADINDQLLQTVLWAITTVFTLAGVILGLNWYQGEKRYQEQRSEVDKALKDSAKSLAVLRTEVSDLREELNSVREEIREVRISGGPNLPKDLRD